MRDVAVNVYIQSCHRFYRLKHSRSLSCSLNNELSCNCPGGCRRNFACYYAHKGYQLPVYRCLWSFSTLITQDARPKIVVAWLTIIVKMGQGACSYFYVLERQPIQRLYITTTNSRCNHLTYRIKNCSHSVDGHFPDHAGSMSHSRWPIQAASIALMYSNAQCTL